MTSERICILGGGLLGQVLALRLAGKGHTVTICEAAPDTGGLASAWQVGGITWDRFYHVILPADDRTLALLEEIGLSDNVVWKKTRTGFYSKGRISPLDNAFDYLRLPILGPIAKGRLAFTIMMASRIANGRPLEKVLVSDWLRKWSGKAAFERLWHPLLRAKLGRNAEIASAAFIWATIRRLYLARSAGAKSEVLGYVEGGYGTVLNALSDRLNEAGVETLTRSPVSSVRRVTAGLQVDLPEGIRHFDRVISTLPCPVTASICSELQADIRERLDGVTYQGIICASVVLDRPLRGDYLTYLADDGLPFTAVVEMSALTGTEAFNGKTLVYLPRYADQKDTYWDLDDDEIERQFLEGLRRVYPDLRPEHVRAIQLSRVRNVMAVPTLSYSEFAPKVATNVDGFYIANSAQITDGTLNVNSTLGVVEAALETLAADMTQSVVRSAA